MMIAIDLTPDVVSPWMSGRLDKSSAEWVQMNKLVGGNI
jgi:hypothetical protein